MMNALGNLLKYSGLVLVILVLSHIVEIKGITISQHVENGLNMITGGRHVSHMKVTQQFSSAQKNIAVEDADGLSRNDKNELNRVIENTARHR